eukprot:885093_1
MPYILASILQPIFGWISDKYGHRSQLLLVASVLYVSAHNMLLVLRVDHNPIIVPVCALVLLGVAYALFTSVIWACYAFVVDDRVLTIAYGIPTSVYNLIATVSFAMVGALTSETDDSHKYEKVEWFLLIMSISSVASSFYLMQLDAQTGYRLTSQNTHDYEKVNSTDIDSAVSDNV